MRKYLILGIFIISVILVLFVVNRLHEKYIEEAINGVLMQETDFEVELVISNDNSPDQTDAIIQRIIKEHPKGHWINYIKHEKNLGMMPNAIDNLKQCSGEYIACCEGDDYWTEPKKLQKQVDFLESNTEYSAVAHQSFVIYQDNSVKKHLFKENIPPILNLNNVLSERHFHTASLVFKSEFVKKNPLPLNIISGDRALFMLCAIFGPIRYIDETMCVYRKNTSGISTYVTPDMMKKDLNIIPWIKSIYPDFPSHKYFSLIHKTIILYPKSVPINLILRHYTLYLFYSMSDFPHNIRQIAGFSLYALPKILMKSIRKT